MLLIPLEVFEELKMGEEEGKVNNKKMISELPIEYKNSIVTASFTSSLYKNIQP